MNEHALLHIMDSQMSFPISKNKIVIRLRASREDKDAKVYLVYGPKFTYQITREEIPMEIKYTDKLFNYYEVTLDLKDTRLAYVFRFEQNGENFYFSEDGLTKTYDFQQSFYNFFQMPFINEIDVMPLVDWMKYAVFYQIFIDRFSIGDRENIKHTNLKWGEKPNQFSFAGGDIQGIIDKLDYLQELGINTLYLTPIFTSPSNHKYNTIDYYEIDSHFGDKKIFGKLVKELHRRDMKIVLDAVFNHISDESYIFSDVKEKGKKSRYYDWFYIDGEFPDSEKVNYLNFAFVNYMPKLKTSNPQVQDFLINIGKYWIESFDIDGWRLDVSDEVSHDFWKRFRKEIKSIKEDVVILGENWHDSYSYLQGDQFDSIMNYSFTKASLDYFKGIISTEEMSNKLNHILTRNKDQVNRMNLNLLDSHDTHRIFTELDNNKNKVLAALALLIVYMGVPCIYYGTEIFLEGGYDPDSRRTFDWNKLNEVAELDMIKEIISIKGNKSISDGDIKIESNNGTLIVTRNYLEETIKLIINLEEKQTIETENYEVLIKNNFEKNILNKDGFMILKQRSKYEN